MSYEISTDPARLDVDRIHRFLSTEAYWSPGVARDVVERSIDSSLCFGVYTEGGEQVGFARAVTDRATFAWIADVYIEDGHRGDGIGKRLVRTILDHPDLQGLRRVMLATADAHGLYRQFGFDELQAVGRFMARESGAAAQAARGLTREQRSWMSATGSSVRAGGVTCVRRGEEVLIPFPDVLPGAEVLDLGAARVGCWAAGPSPELDAHLRGLGFEPGWRPHWMSAPAAAAPLDTRVSEPSEVPEYDDHGRSLLALTRQRPQTSFLFVAREGGRFAGHAWLHVAAGV